jgi:hypothetical protein
MTDLDDAPLHRIWLAGLQVGLRHVLEHGGAHDEALLPFWSSTIQEMFSGEMKDKDASDSWAGLTDDRRREMMAGKAFCFESYVEEIKDAIEGALADLTNDDEGCD